MSGTGGLISLRLQAALQAAVAAIKPKVSPSLPQWAPYNHKISYAKTGWVPAANMMRFVINIFNLRDLKSECEVDWRDGVVA